MLKTTDGRFVETRIVLPIGVISQVLFDVKTRNNWTWNEFAKRLSISGHTLSHDIVSKGNTLPFSVFNKILSLTNDAEAALLRKNCKKLMPFWGQRNQKEAKVWKTPDTNTEKFAEFYGIMLGDGCIYSNLSSICISGNSLLDKYYIEGYVSRLITSLFGVKPKINYHKNENSMRCIVNSKTITNFLYDFGFPKGKKKMQNTKIPNKFIGKPDLFYACLRGLNDTDGSIYPQNSKIAVDICIKSPTLLKSALKGLKRTNLEFGYTNDRVYFSGERRVKSFMTKIGSSNFRNILKFKNFLEKGYTPKTKEMAMLLKQNLYSIRLPYYGPVV